MAEGGLLPSIYGMFPDAECHKLNGRRKQARKGEFPLSPLGIFEWFVPEFEKEAVMLYRLGRFLQLLGLLICPAGIAGNVARPEEITLKVSLVIAGCGIVVFILGWLLQQANPPR